MAKPNKATTFADMFGLGEMERQDNPGKKSKKAGATCPPKKRCPPAGERFERRRIGKFEGIYDRQAGTGARRGKFVKRGDLKCSSQHEALDPVLSELLHSEQETAQRERRGPYEVWQSMLGLWIVYDTRSGTLLGESFNDKGAVTRFIKAGKARSATCPPGGASAPMQRKDNPSGAAKKPASKKSGAKKAAAAKKPASKKTAKGTTPAALEKRVTRLEDQAERTDVRLARVENNTATALRALGGKGKSKKQLKG